jgi:hypothetical protein
VHHPYVTAVLSAQRHRDLVAAAGRARRGRAVAPQESAPRRLLTAWRAAWGTVGALTPGPRMHDYPLRRTG